jgi:hypothetical protein
MVMNKHFHGQCVSATLLACVLAVAPLTGCDRRPSDVPRPSDPDRNTPKPKAMPDTKTPDGSPASAPQP